MGDLHHGSVWLADFDPIIGHEQGGRRPCLIVSRTTFNVTRSKLVVVLPITSKVKNLGVHVRIDPPEGGLTVTSYAMCEMVRSISHDRLEKPMGALTDATLARIADELRVLLDL